MIIKVKTTLRPQDCRQAEELLQSDISYRKDIWQTSAMMLKQNVEFSFIEALKFLQNVD